MPHAMARQITSLHIEVVEAELPGRALCAFAAAKGVMWLVVDARKPGADAHARELLRPLLPDQPADDRGGELGTVLPFRRPSARIGAAIATLSACLFGGASLVMDQVVTLVAQA